MRALSAPIRKSQAEVMQPPAPVAMPCTAQMVGCGISCIDRMSWAPNSAPRRRISNDACAR